MYQWCVYWNPSDCPGVFVARKWLIRGGVPTPTNETIIATELHDVRAEIIDRDPWMLFMGPQDGDDPCIVEVWF